MNKKVIILDKKTYLIQIIINIKVHIYLFPGRGAKVAPRAFLWSAPVQAGNNNMKKKLIEKKIQLLKKKFHY